MLLRVTMLPRLMGYAAAVAAMFATTAACTDDLDPPWQLDHDRIIAVRATPPSILPGQHSELDALIAHQDAPTSVAFPDSAVVASPASLADLVTRSGDAANATGAAWIVSAPDASRLAAARTELGLPPDAPVPLVVHVTFAGATLPATKTLWLGVAADNPQLGAMTIDGANIDDARTEIAIATKTDVPLSISADDTDDVTWLTSCGTLHDFDLPAAYLRVEPDDPDDPADGELVVVRRDARGGVAWQSWSIRAE